MTLLQRAKELFKRDKSFSSNGWRYDYKPMGAAVEVTITTPEQQVLRPVLMPRAGYDWFNHG